MDSGQLTAVLIVAIVMFASIIRAGMRGGSRRRTGSGGDQAQAQILAENQRLREEVTGLKDRLHVLERIAVEKENSLSKEIEALRDR